MLWELSKGPRASRALRDATSISPAVLQRRHDTLRAAQIVEWEKGAGYQLTATGEALIASFSPLYAFAADWTGALGAGLEPAAGSN